MTCPFLPMAEIIIACIHRALKEHWANHFSCIITLKSHEPFEVLLWLAAFTDAETKLWAYSKGCTAGNRGGWGSSSSVASCLKPVDLSPQTFLFLWKDSLWCYPWKTALGKPELTFPSPAFLCQLPPTSVWPVANAAFYDNQLSHLLCAGATRSWVQDHLHPLWTVWPLLTSCPGKMHQSAIPRKMHISPWYLDLFSNFPYMASVRSVSHWVNREEIGVGGGIGKARFALASPTLEVTKSHSMSRHFMKSGWKCILCFLLWLHLQHI